MNNGECKMQGCIKKMIVPVIALMVFQFGFEWLVHGVWLKPIYEQTSQLWRPMNEMGMFPWCLIRLFTLSLLFGALYCKCAKKMENCATPATGDKKECPKKAAVCFGIVLGLLIGVMNASSYLWMPIPGELAIKWLIAGIVEGVCIALILSCVCKKKDSTAA